MLFSSLGWRVLGGVGTDQFIAQEFVRSVDATLGLIAAVLQTTGLATLTSERSRSTLQVV